LRLLFYLELIEKLPKKEAKKLKEKFKYEEIYSRFENAMQRIVCRVDIHAFSYCDWGRSYLIYA
jgi:hypothetical protein